MRFHCISQWFYAKESAIICSDIILLFRSNDDLEYKTIETRYVGFEVQEEY